MGKFLANRPVLVGGAVLMTGAVFEASDAEVADRLKSGAVAPVAGDAEDPKPKTKPKAKAKAKAKPKAKPKK